MKVLSIILGILLTIFGISMFATPVANFFTVGLALMIVFVVTFLVFGIKELVRCIKEKEFSGSFVLAILSILLAIFFIFGEGVLGVTTAVMETIYVYAAAFWMIIMGITRIDRAVKIKKVFGKNWVPVLIVGILGILLGVFALFNPAFIALTIGFMIALFFIFEGLTLIVGAFSE